ncbi:SIR2 family protein [Paenibacillus cucumis (ex Kampfer et al. 2016)]|uniref:SIR2 family protein n=1 Tax=Paenibacillus cucumis (ex Kampfer et al. 2016) TaxID=1776858 RepID=A0ABS7KD01_9BACL|nr:SIR2 family protein [Paenibacillus cucumis (ex Kampfer et al. 2016)]MBY0202014.1 SIR2 family protein [Paenibacillus cucumis (ex Kampfer et al. 2016)]
MTTVLDSLAEKNEFPIVFIGSGISKRFLNDFPDWPTLLAEFWVKAGMQNFYGELNNVLSRVKSEYPEFNDREVEHEAYIQIGATLETIFNQRFNDGEILIEGFTPHDSFKTKLSPFKKAVANRFLSYSLRDGMEVEYESFVKMIRKTQIILTTNYDTFVEDSYNSLGTNQIKKFIGQKGFFTETFNYAELYKLHGCAQSPSDIVLAKEDYNKFDKNSVLISAKIISMMLTSPIIFMGYSLTDVNVRKIISDFSSSLSDAEVQLLEERLILLEWSEGEQGLVEEVLNDRDLGCKLKVIKTDNYGLVFDKISSVNQGVTPSEVRKYQHVIKQLIVDRGRKGSLNSLLVSPVQLEDIEERIGDGKLVVALGDTTYIFRMPDLVSYSYDYFFESDQLNTDIALRFIASQNKKSRLPFLKFTKDLNLDETNLHPFDKEKIKQRIAAFPDANVCIKTINSSYKVKVDTIEEIIEQKFKQDKEYDVIAYNSPRLDLDKLQDYIKEKLSIFRDGGARGIPTSLRRLITIYDLIINK